MALPNNPQTRKEMYLSNMAGQGTALPSEPHTREEEYLDFIAKNGGGGGGTGDGDMKKSVYDNDNAVLTAGGIKPFVNTAISGKVDKVQGKGLSTNDYDDSAKAIVDNVTTDLDAKQPKTLSEPIYVDGVAKFSVETAIDAVNGLAASNKSALLTKADTSQIAAIQDGQNIDSFGDVETALAGKMPNYGIGTGLYVDSDTNQLRADAVTLAIKDSPKLITSGAVFSGLSPKYGTAEQDETDLDGQDKFPFYDNSASAKRHTTFGNIKAKLKEYFDSLYVAAVAGKGLSTNDYDDTEKAKVAGAFPRSEQAVLGAKNRLRNTATSTTNHGVQFVVNDDKSVTIKSGGEADSDIYFPIFPQSADPEIPQGNYIISGGFTPPQNLSIKFYLNERNADNTQWGNQWADTTGNGVAYTRANDYHYAYFIFIKNGTQITSDIVVKPMVRLATDTDSTYARYTMTNKELTENNAVKNLVITPSSGITINTGSYAKIRNGILNAYISLKSESADITAFTELARIDGISGANDELFNLAGINTTTNSAVACYCPFIKATGRIAIQTRTNVTANQTVNVMITAILE